MKLNPLSCSTILLLLFIIFIGNQIAQHVGISGYFTTSYLDDLLCFPIVLLIVQMVHRKFYNERFLLPISHIIFSVVFFSVIFEIILPTISPRYTADYLDLLCYLIGSIIFYLINTIGNQSTPTYTFTARQTAVRFYAKYP